MKLKLAFYSSLFISVFIASISTNISLAATKNDKSAKRWFEVEVILFRQLADRSELKELFPESSQLPYTKNSVDFLTPYLHPDISSLKLQLPRCSSAEMGIAQKENSNTNTNTDYPYFNKAGVLPDLIILKDLAQIDAMPNDELLEEYIEQQLASDNNVKNIDTNNSQDVLAKNMFIDSTISEHDSTDTKNVNSDSINEENDPLVVEDLPLTAEELVLIALADEAAYDFSNKAIFNLAKLPSFFFANKHFCQIAITPITPFLSLEEKALQQIFSVNSFNVDKMPSTVNAPEWLDSNQPYLINKNSLQLGDIVQKLRWSKNFQPLLHIGWRQAPVTRKKSIAMKIMAGDNLETHYQKALTSYQAMLTKLDSEKIELAEVKANQNNVLSQLAQPSVTDFQETFNKAQLAQQQHLANIFSQLTDGTSANTIAEQLISQLNTPINLQELIENEQLSEKLITPPKMPLQEWFLQGFFKVHLDHYLYITADFSVLNKTIAEQATQSLSSSEPIELKTIGFNQNRRVISGEIHYFDHPYIGMIVQIRRYKRPEPEIDVEADVTLKEAIN